MAVRGPGRWSQLWTNLKKSVTLARQTEVYVGRDEHGNMYYEKQEDAEKGLKRQRRVQPSFSDQYRVPDVPVEWATWLQGRRLHPPAEEEMTKNLVTKIKTQRRADDLQQERQAEEMEMDKEKAENVSSGEDTRTIKFPVYPDYEINPSNYKQVENKEKS